MNLSYNNHIKFYVDDVLYGDSTDPRRKFRVEVGQIDKELYKRSNYNEELKRVTDIQYKTFGKDLIVFLSGGLDSEIVVRSYVANGIYPRCIIMRFINFMRPGVIENLVEVNAAVETANAIGIDYEFFDFDVLKFYVSGEAKEMAIKYTSYLFPMLVYYKVSTLLASHPCIFCGEVLLDKHRDIDNNPIWYYRFQEILEAAPYRVTRDTGIPIVIDWFSYTPELLLYFLESPHIVNLVNTRSYRVSTTSIKNDVLKTLVPAIKDTTKIKTWGYENLTKMVVEANWQFTAAMPFRIDTADYGTKYHEIVAMLKG
jgi:hypothetical protein